MESDEISLREYVDMRLQAQEKAVTVALAAAEKAVLAAAKATQMAGDKAELENQRWRDAANEWRNAMTDRERDFMSRREFYSIVGVAVLVVGLLITILQVH